MQNFENQPNNNTLTTIDNNTRALIARAKRNAHARTARAEIFEMTRAMMMRTAQCDMILGKIPP